MGSYPYADITVPDNRQRDEYVLMAKICNRTERYEEMLKIIEKIVLLYTPRDVLTAEERGLFTAAYGRVCMILDEGWRTMFETERRVETRADESHVAQVRAYKSKIEAEMREVCRGALNLMNKNLLRCIVPADEKAFYMRVKGDYNTLLTQFVSNVTLDAYSSAQEIAQAEMDPAHPGRLMTSLNLSVFYHDLKRSPQLACDVARRAIDEANVQLPSLRGQAYKESNQIVNVLRDNLTKWTAELQEQSEEA